MASSSDQADQAHSAQNPPRKDSGAQEKKPDDTSSETNSIGSSAFLDDIDKRLRANIEKLDLSKAAQGLGDIATAFQQNATKAVAAAAKAKAKEKERRAKKAAEKRSSSAAAAGDQGDREVVYAGRPRLIDVNSPNKKKTSYTHAPPPKISRGRAALGDDEDDEEMSDDPRIQNCEHIREARSPFMCCVQRLIIADAANVNRMIAAGNLFGGPSSVPMPPYSKHPAPTTDLEQLNKVVHDMNKDARYSGEFTFSVYDMKLIRLAPTGSYDRHKDQAEMRTFLGGREQREAKPQAEVAHEGGYVAHGPSGGRIRLTEEGQRVGGMLMEQEAKRKADQGESFM